MHDLIKKILNARVYDVTKVTPLDVMPRLSARLNHQILIKREDAHPIFSFKLRGAYNMIAQLSDDQKARGIIGASAGNHAQGMALSGQTLGIKTTIVMPVTAPQLKVQACRSRGAQVVIFGDTFDDAYHHAVMLQQQEGLTFIHPFDDEEVIAGQGTVGKEILEQCTQQLDVLFVPVGGGGLIAGIAAYIKFLRPRIKIIGVEAVDAPTLFAAQQAGQRVVLPQVGVFADGAAVKQIGARTFEIAQRYVDEVILVSTDEICAAMKDIFDDTRAIAEPAGALSVAGAKKYLAAQTHQKLTVCTILSGANINFDRLRHVAERAEVGERREALLAVTIPEQAGSFRRFIELLGSRAITEFNYRYASDVAAHVFVGVQLVGADKEKQEIIEALTQSGYAIEDLSDNEMAKSHVRYMVGGQVHALSNEVLYRFQFPERPGALLRFLSQMQHGWNISLFHYRNHGSDYGRVLVGMQIPVADQQAFAVFLAQLGYEHWSETDNPAYQLFLNAQALQTEL